MGELRIMDHTGDTPIVWDKNDPASVEIARAAFDKAREKKCLLYRTDKNGNKAQIIHKSEPFDVSAEKIIAAPQNVGG